METVVTKLYEAMFLIDSALAASDWEGVNKTIEKILERAGAEIVSIRKWDERRLAYDIDKKSRGTYILCYFNVNGRKIQQIERDVQLSDRIMRVLILSTEQMTQENIEKDTPAVLVEKSRQKTVHETSIQIEQDQPVKEEELPEEARERENLIESKLEGVEKLEDSEQSEAENDKGLLDDRSRKEELEDG